MPWQFEIYLAQLKPLEQKPQEIIRINEIERLFNQFEIRWFKYF